VIVEVAACGVCGHDILQRQGKVDPDGSLGTIPGHEIAGTVVELGEGVDRFKVGDRVASTIGARCCGVCRHCQAGRSTLCTQRMLYGEAIPGGYAQFVAIEAVGLAQVPDDVDLKAAALAGCAIGTGLHALLLAGTRVGDRVAITGAGGGVGVHALQVARAIGAEVVAITSSPSKVGLLQSLADTVVVLEDGRYDRQLRELGRRPDVVLELTAKHTLGESLRVVERGGSVVIAGNLEEGPVPVLPGAFIYREIRMLGSKAATVSELETCLGLLSRGTVRAQIDRTLPLSRAAEAHELMEMRSVAGRVVLVPDAVAVTD
jgi:D-arabinose 1-dehydrogenase-like Zn-dependent alcohol dehydrogenase